MKRFIFMALFAAFAMPSAVQADLVAGWNTFANPDGAINNAANVTATGFTGGAVTDSNDWGQTSSFNSPTTDYGATLAGTGGPSALSLNNGLEGSVDFTVTNNSGSDYDLDFFHFDGGSRRPGAADSWTLSILSGGALTAGDVTTGVTVSDGDADVEWTDYDLSLSGLADNTLEDGQSVVFRLDFVKDSTQGPSGHNQYTDNIAVSGSVVSVPEPSSLAILGLAGLGVFVRRRK